MTNCDAAAATECGDARASRFRSPGGGDSRLDRALVMDLPTETPVLPLGADRPVHGDGPVRWTGRLRRGGRIVLVRLAQIAGGLLVWHAIVKALAIDPRIVPAPLDVIRTLIALTIAGQMQAAALVTLQETIYGFVIGSFLGIGLAVALSEIPPLRRLLQPYIVALQAVPKVAVAPLFLIWFGFDIESKIALVISIMFFPVLVNTLVGLDSVSDDQLELMRSYRATRWQTLRRVKVYVALPYVFAAFEVCLVLSLTAAVVAEMLGSGTTMGLGSLINIYSARMSSAGVFAVLVVLSILGVLLHAAVLMTARRCLAWQRSSNGK
jgi:NitT/TauT family transport system permease protein